MRRVLGISSATDRGWLLWAARFGYAACGFIYVVVGAFALAVSLGVREEPTGLHGVMRFLARQPFSPFLLATLAIGLAGYAALNITGAITDPERRGFSFIALIQRAADILTGALYIGLAFAALSLIVGVSGNTDAATAVSRKLLAIPFGPTIIRLAGISLLVGSVYLFIRAATEEFGEMLDKRSLSRRVRNAIELAARAGTAARAVVFAICGVYAIRFASRASRDVADVGDALNTIGHAVYGQFLLAVMGLSFIAYGVYQFSKAGYQRVVDAV